MKLKLLTPIELRQQGFAILVEHLGVANALRFMGQFEVGQGDYTKERDALFEDETVEQLALLRRLATSIRQFVILKLVGLPSWEGPGVG